MKKKQKKLPKKDKAMVWNQVVNLAKSNRPNYNPQKFAQKLKAARLCLNHPVNGKQLSETEKAQIWELVIWKIGNATADFDFHEWAEQLKAARLDLAAVETEE